MLAAFRLFLTSIIKSAYKTYFWSDLSSKKSFAGKIGLEGLHLTVEKKTLKAQI